MKSWLLFIAVTNISMIAGCGGGDADNASPALGNASASTPASSVVATPSIDPPSPPITMSAGVTETIDAPRPAGVLAQLPNTSSMAGDESSSVVTQQVSPVVHYAPDSSAGSDD